MRRRRPLLKDAIDELRWTYLNEKADFMQESTLMEVSKGLDTIGLHVPNQPLESIKIPADE